MVKKRMELYRKEFDHWLNGGELLARTRKSYFLNKTVVTDWWLVDGINSNFSMENLLYEAPNVEVQFVINDKYVEFRKALADGKEVQVLIDNKWCTIKHSHEFLDNYTYRISPGLEVGDWATYDNGYTDELFEVKKMTKDGKVKYKHKILEATSLKKWVPKAGDWVIPKQVNGKAGTYISGFEVRMWTNDDVYECEPFIGQLPSFIR